MLMQGFPPPPEQRVTLTRPSGSRSRSGGGAADRTPDRWGRPGAGHGGGRAPLPVRQVRSDYVCRWSDLPRRRLVKGQQGSGLGVGEVAGARPLGSHVMSGSSGSRDTVVSASLSIFRGAEGTDRRPNTSLPPYDHAAAPVAHPRVTVRTLRSTVSPSLEASGPQGSRRSIGVSESKAEGTPSAGQTGGSRSPAPTSACRAGSCRRPPMPGHASASRGHPSASVWGYPGVAEPMLCAGADTPLGSHGR
jgi:hypothetical protein